MRGFLYLCCAMAVMVLAFWAYRENYETQQSLREVERLQHEIGSLRVALVIQRAEWAYLNRPSRLRDLADLNFERLQLMPLGAQHFGAIDQVSYPAPELPPITDPVELRGTLTDPGESQ